MRIRGILFDMDGLMFDTERISRLSFDYVEKELGIDLRTDMPDMTGMSVKEIARLYFEKYGPDHDFYGIREKRIAFTRRYVQEHGLPVKPGLRELVSYLRAHGYRWAMATSSSRAAAERNLKLTGMLDDFPCRICGDMVEHSKPDPQIFLCAAAKIETIPAETVVLEDSYNGIRAAYAGGFIACMVPDLREPDEEISALLTRRFDTLADVIPFLEENTAKE